MEPVNPIPVQYNMPVRMNEFVRDALRRTSLPYLGWLLFAIVLSLGAYYPWRDSGIRGLHPGLFAYYVTLIGHIIFRVKSGGRANALAPDMIFLFFYTMFHLGYLTIYGLGLIPYFEMIFVYEASIPQALFVVNLGLLGFLFGYELWGTKNPQSAISQPVKIPTQNWCTLGLVLMIIAAAMHIIPLIVIGATELTALGYQAVATARGYFSSTLAMFLTQSNHLLFFGSVIYMISSSLRYQKVFSSKIAMGIFFGMIAIFLLEGDRGPVVQLMVPFLIAKHYLVKRIRLRYLLVLFILFSTVLAGLALVRRVAFNPSMMWQSYKYARSEGAVDWRNLFIEAGGSVRCTIITCENVPTHDPHWHGKTYLSAALHVFPFLEGHFIKRGTFGIYYWPSVWVSQAFDHGLGAIGYTIASEGYLNFGFPGAFLELMFFGILIRIGMVWFAKRPSATLGFIMFCWIIYPLMAVRNHIQLITGYAFFQVPIIAAFAYLLCKNEPQLDVEHLYAGAEENTAFLESTNFESESGGYAPQPS